MNPASNSAPSDLHANAPRNSKKASRLPRGTTTCTLPLDTVQILWTAPGKLASKQFHKASSTSEVIKRDYDAGYSFVVLAPWPVNSIYELSPLLQAAEELPEALVIRGAPVTTDIVGSRAQRRGSGEGADFVGTFRTPAPGRCYAMIDIDKYVLPRGWTLNQTSVPKICEHLVQQLPKEFHNVSYHWQLSSSAGIGDPRVVSMHLWFWFDRPVPDADLKVWAKRINTAAGKKLVDDALFQHVQAHYTAAPIFTGMDDPFPRRSGLVQKVDDSVALVLPERETPVTPVKTSTAGAAARDVQVGAGFDYHLGQIGDHAGGAGFHGSIIRAAASYVATHGADGTDVEELYTMISERVLAADASQHDAGYITHMASREHIIPAINSALPRFGKSARPRKSRLYTDLAPHYIAETISVVEAQQWLDAQIADLFT